MTEVFAATGPNGAVGQASMSGRLECTGVTVRFGGLTALDDVDLAVEPGTIVGLVGPNGAGKSTLFGVMSGLLRPTRGKVMLDGEDITRTRPQLRAAHGLARTFQHPEMFTGLSVRDHLVLSQRVRNAKSRIWTDLFTLGSLRTATPEEKSTVDGLMKLLGLEPMADLTALGLPLGSSRLVELGRALATEPRILLLDEPSSGLDSAETEQFEMALQRVVRERGISVLLVEHDVELVMRNCSDIYVLDFGAMIARGTPEQVRANPAVRAAYLGEEVTAQGDEAPAQVVSRAETDQPPAGEAQVPTDNKAPTRAPTDNKAPVLRVEELCVRYGDASALYDLSLSIDAGQVLAVLGANGAGKSSLARAVSGLVRPSSGKVLLAGREIQSWSPYRIRRAGMVHLPEGRGIFRGLTVLDNLRMATEAVPGGRPARRQALDLALSTFPILADRRRQTASSLSGGEQQMLSLARALATAPAVLVADEMSLGLAPRMVDLVFDGLDRARKAGVTVLMIEQYVHRALAFADQCVVLHRGRLAWEGPAREAGAEVLSHYLGDAMTAAS